jgi:arginase family enzyme
MMLTIYQGRAGDRNERALAGSVLLGDAIAAHFELVQHLIGRPQPPLQARWDAELAAARPDLGRLGHAYEQLLSQQRRPVALIGRCTAALGTLPVVARHRPDACIVWFDAHGDSNLPSSSAVPYLGGMVITGAAGHWDSGLGSGLSMSNVVLVGARDLDPHERQLVASGVLNVVATGHKLVERLVDAVVEREVYVHLDCDVLEPGLVPLEYQVPGGLSFDDLRACAVELRKRRILGVEIAEFECEWLDGRPGSPERLVDALTPLLS